MQHPPLRHAVAASGLVVAACAVLMVLAAMDGSMHQQQVVLKGMSGKSAQQDLDSYFDSMDQSVKQAQALAAQHLKRETSMLSKQEQSEELTARGLASSKPAKHGLKAKVANAKLSGYFKKQALAIKQHEKQVAEERNENEPQALSTMAANKDLNSYFDALNVPSTKEGKLDLLAKQVSSLTKDFEEIAKPVKSLKQQQEDTQDTIRNLNKQSQQLLKESSERGSTASRAEAAAQAAAASAEKALNAKPSSVVVNSVEKVLPKHVRNPALQVFGLPPGWKAFMDRRTRYAYFYNKHSGDTTWVNPKGTEVKGLKGMPFGWEALKEKGGQVYYVDHTSGESTFVDPRLKAGAEVLDLIAGQNHFRSIQAKSKVKMSKLAALRDDHGVYAHNLPRSQWADRQWMRFLAPSNDVGGPMGGMTNDEMLRRGLDGSTHPVLQRAASSRY